MSDVKATSSPSEGTASSKAEFFAGLIGLCVWFALFVVGTRVDSTPHREMIAGDAGLAERIQAFIVVLFCYTPSNTAMLSCVASVLGGLFRRMRARQRHRLLAPSLLVLLLSLVFQGFVVYLVMASGILSFGGWSHFFDNPSQDQYLRLASTCSLISLMIGYSPGLFNSLMGRLEKWVEQGITIQRARPVPDGHRNSAEPVDAKLSPR